MSDDRFVTEADLEKQRAQRQQEWEAARKPDDPEKAPEESYDHRPLFERLREQREKKQAEFEENHRLKNMVRGLDTEEVGFLEFVDNMKAKEERQRQIEEKQLLSELHKHDLTRILVPPTEEMPSCSAKAQSKTTTATTTTSKISKQAQLLKSAIKRKSDNDEGAVESKRVCAKANEGPEEKAQTLERPMLQSESTRRLAAVRPSLALRSGSLPGLDGYDSDSSSRSSDSSASAGEPAANGADKPVANKSSAGVTTGHGSTPAGGGSASSKSRN